MNFFCLKQLPSNFTCILVFIQSSERTILIYAAETLKHSLGHSFDFHAEVTPLLAFFVKYLRIGWNNI